MVWRGDICQLAADAVVNAANEELLSAWGSMPRVRVGDQNLKLVACFHSFIFPNIK